MAGIVVTLYFAALGFVEGWTIINKILVSLSGVAVILQLNLRGSRKPQEAIPARHVADHGLIGTFRKSLNTLWEKGTSDAATQTTGENQQATARHSFAQLNFMSKRGYVGLLLVIIAVYGLYDHFFVSEADKRADANRALKKGVDDLQFRGTHSVETSAAISRELQRLHQTDEEAMWVNAVTLVCGGLLMAS